MLHEMRVQEDLEEDPSRNQMLDDPGLVEVLMLLAGHKAAQNQTNDSAWLWSKKKAMWERLRLALDEVLTYLTLDT